MIKKYQIKKIFLLAIFLTLLTTMNVTEVNALWEADNSNTTTGTSGGTSRPTGTATKDYGNGITATCKWYVSVRQWSRIEVEMYDMYGNKINDPLNVTRSLKMQGLDSILAGTYVGLDIYEEKGYSVSSRYEVSARRTYYECHRDAYTYYYNCSKDPSGKPIYSSSTCSIKRVPSNTYESTTGCYSGYRSIKKSEPVATTGNMESWCAEKAKPRVSISLEPSYKVSYRDSNDINAVPSNDKYYTGATISTNTGCGPKVTSGSSSSQTCTFHYNREDACINVKNGKVRYIAKNGVCDSETEYKISSNGKYWKYFIPLNTTSSKGFSLTMHSSGSKQDPAICKNYIDKYDEYKDLIIDQNGNPFTADDTKTTAKKKVANGCYYQTTIKIPVEQKFYNEVGGDTLKGFNFYYKPIEITNPFPNGLNDTSLWYDWNKSAKKDPDLTKSYNEVTYVAQISNVNSIRDYTQKYPYTTWENMYTSGISGFIEKEEMVERLTDRNKIYALGCGPANSNVTNIFQQKECDG